MNVSAFPATSGNGEYAGLPPILIAATSDDAGIMAAMAAEAGGFRTAPVAIDEAAERIEIQPQASAIWIELDKDPGSALDALLDRVQVDASADCFPAIITAPLPLIDRIMARVECSSVELLVDPTPVDRIAALALVVARRSTCPRLNDISNEPRTIRLRQLSDEVGRIAATLSRLSVGQSGEATGAPQQSVGLPPEIGADIVRQVIRARRVRARYFDGDLFADPAWDMLLDLLQAEIGQYRVPVSSLCIAAAVPPTTALRWIKTMTDAGLFKRRADPHDGRRIFIELSAGASDAMRRYFDEVGKLTVA